MAVQIGRLVRDHASETMGIVVPNIEEWPSPMVAIMFLNDDLWPTAIMTASEKTFNEQYDFLEMPKKDYKVVIMADMEGITGVPNDWAAVTPAEETGGVPTEIYRQSCLAMKRDVLMAVAGARAAGAKEIIVADSHWHDTNLLDADFDVPVVRGSAAAIRAMEGAHAVMLIGWHARAGAAQACLAHTYTERIKRLSIDGQEVGELGMLARLAAAQGAPVLLVSGDKAACDEIESDIGCRTVATRSVDEEGHVSHRPPMGVWRELFGHAFTLVRNLDTADKPALPRHEPGHFEVEVHEGYDTLGDDIAKLVEVRTYEIEMGSILETYTQFQQFVERLPELTN
jgi:D-aminopeptidase